MLTMRDLEIRLATGRGPLRLAVEACKRFPGFSKSVFVNRSNQVLVEFGVFGGNEGTLRIQAEFSSGREALEQGLTAAGFEDMTAEEHVVVDAEWLPEFPDDCDLVESETLLREALSVRDPELFPSFHFAAIPDEYWGLAGVNFG
jgi:hypothetical protein